MCNKQNYYLMCSRLLFKIVWSLPWMNKMNLNFVFNRITPDFSLKIWINFCKMSGVLILTMIMFVSHMKCIKLHEPHRFPTQSTRRQCEAQPDFSTYQRFQWKSWKKIKINWFFISIDQWQNNDINNC